MFKSRRIFAAFLMITMLLIGIYACGQPEADQAVDKAAIRV